MSAEQRRKLIGAVERYEKFLLTGEAELRTKLGTNGEQAVLEQRAIYRDVVLSLIDELANESRNADARQTHLVDQATAGIRDFARMAGAYFRTLIEDGIEHDDASELTAVYITTWIQCTLENGNKQKPSA
jgi:hypothetical protein